MFIESKKINTGIIQRLFDEKINFFGKNIINLFSLFFFSMLLSAISFNLISSLFIGTFIIIASIETSLSNNKTNPLSILSKSIDVFFSYISIKKEFFLYVSIIIIILYYTNSSQLKNLYQPDIISKLYWNYMFGLTIFIGNGFKIFNSIIIREFNLKNKKTISFCCQKAADKNKTLDYITEFSLISIILLSPFLPKEIVFILLPLTGFLTVFLFKEIFIKQK